MSPEIPAGATWLLLVGLPLLLVATTCFAKVSVVLAALRTGLGAETLLPLSVMLTLALVVSAVVMGPVLVDLRVAVESAGGVEGLFAGGLDGLPGLFAPLREFMELHVHQDELDYFAQLQGRGPEDPLVLVPAFLVSELTEALVVAVMVLLPFLVLDLLVVQVALLLGMPGTHTAPYALPLKVLLFLAAGGWDVILGGLVEAYA